MKTCIVFIIAAMLAVAISGLEYKEARMALSDSKPQSCQQIIDTSVFSGNCCSLNTSQGDGCVVSIKNGWCTIEGQYWANTWNSTDDRIQCDGSEYDVPYINRVGGIESAASALPFAGAVALCAAVIASLL